MTPTTASIDCDYRLLDSGGFRKLEQIGPMRLIRPSAAACWLPQVDDSEWSKADFEFIRSGAQDGIWTPVKGGSVRSQAAGRGNGEGGRAKNQERSANAPRQSPWVMAWPPVRLEMRLTDFGHIGLFPEHASQWRFIQEASAQARNNVARPARILNLFAYTGAISLIAAQAGAEVVHVDASKTSLEWAKVNAAHSGLANAPIRWILDDVSKFCKREARRGSRYQGIILDPPSFGRGPQGELWKIEEHLNDLLADLRSLADESRFFVILSCHTPGYTARGLDNIVSQAFPGLHRSSGELQADGSGAGILPLPAGCYCRAWRGFFLSGSDADGSRPDKPESRPRAAIPLAKA